MNLKRVTITGADDSVKQDDLLELTKRYPFVEWGILLSKNAEGGYARFPTREWINNLVTGYEHLKYKPQLCGHLCGRWVRDVCAGLWTFVDDRPDFCNYFGRFQLNFHAYRHKIEPDRFLMGIKEAWGENAPQLIFQSDGVNEDLLIDAREAGVDAVSLFDLSGGAGILPEEWPKPTYRGFAGYAGGLSPENLQEQLEKIDEICGDNPIWIDVETGVRTKEIFDLGKVTEFLEVANPWVEKSNIRTI